MTIPDTLLDRFFNALVKEIRVSRPAYLQSPFTVAEIYQNLVPYRTHRGVIGAEINGDYEDALLRLLAGEGEFLQLESEPARKRIQDELRGSNPNTTIYREFAAAEVRLHPGRARMLAGDESSGGDRNGHSGAAGDPPGRPGVGSRVDVGWAPEEATPVADIEPSEPGVNPDLGLFVSDLFGGGGGQPQDEKVSVPNAPVAESMPGGEHAEASGAPGKESPPQPGEMEAAVSDAGGAAAAAPSRSSGGSGSGREVGAPALAMSRPSAILRQDDTSLPTPAPAPPRESRREGAGVSELEDENRRLRRIVADQALEILRLRDFLDRS